MQVENDTEEQRIERLETEFVQVLGVTCSTAYQNAIQAGFNVMVSKENKIVEVSPDGSERLVKIIIGPSPAQPGTRYTLQ